MANWCSNHVEYKGEEANIISLLEELRELEKENKKTGLGVRPSEEGDLRYMFDLYVTEDGLLFESKWIPANDSLKLLAKKHRVTLENSYYEQGSMLSGIWKSNGETEEDISLDWEDWDSVTAEDEDESYFFYNEKEYECEEDALDLILQEKLK